jgi:hypothetical protein
MTRDDLAKIMPDIARRFWGEPNRRHSKNGELRWGTHGARAVSIEKGTWFDHECKEGGGVDDFLLREGVADPSQWLIENGYDQDELRDKTPPHTTTPTRPAS